MTRHRAAPSSDLDNAGAVLTRAWPAPSRTARAYTGTSGSFAPDVSLDPRVLGALATLAALLSGAVGAAADPTASVAPLSSPLHWHICDAYNESFLCSELAVPIDYARPADGNLKLAIKRRGGDRLPLHKNKLKCCLRGHLDLNQTDRPIVVGLTNIKIISSGWA